MRAVKTPLLSWRERLRLVFQSRLHSRSRRRFAFVLTETHLPAATINAIVQAARPAAEVSTSIGWFRTWTCAVDARLSGHGGDPARRRRATASSTRTRPLAILLENCEDAYGFPPYSQIESFLHSGNGTNLALVEQTTIRAALSGVPATLLSSSTRDWWLHLPGLIDPELLVGPVSGGGTDPTPLATDLIGALRGDGRLTASSEPALSPDD